jgi:hypothetical protein
MFGSAQQWADALDTAMRTSDQGVGDVISLGYADGHILGVPLLPEHEDADDERGVIVGEAPDGSCWIVRYAAQDGWWETVTR